MAYETISSRPSLTRQALKELAHWNESLQNREARQNVNLLGCQNTPLETLTPNVASDLTTIRKLGWVDKLMKGRQTQKKHEEPLPQPKVHHNIVPEKLEIKRRDKAASFQATFDKQAMNTLEDLLDAVTNKENTAPAGKYPFILWIFVAN